MLQNKIIGNKIAEVRKKINISQAQLAESLFISPQAVGKWERGESMPDIITFNRLAEILGVDLNYFSENFQPSIAETVSTELLPKQTAAPVSETQQKNLSRNMSGMNLVDNDFSGLKDLHERLSGSNMQNCRFSGSDMSGLLLKSNNVEGCDFTGSNISNSHIQRSNLANNIFKNCSLKETKFSGNNIEGCDLSGADLTGVEFRSGGFGKNTIANAVWNRSSFVGMNIEDIVFDGILTDCSFENSSFSRVTFQQATLVNTFFKNNGKLRRVQFINCKVDKLTYAFLKNEKADLSGITLLTE